ncbi:MAG: putative DNA binding domain-containing protein [Prevotellaceae bacterium]|jgi:predicted HTH transcriptional regulator|nr:putative DNA binding domain-containing protein [Prevotellaceae bacterium]
MLDIANIIASGKHFRVELKKAAGGLPDSLWESYSAFANSDGGVIILGISEVGEQLEISGVTAAKKKIKSIWDLLNNRKKVNVNILSERHIYAQQFEGKEIIVIEVPRADRRDRPVYINNDLLGGAYRRNAEGDYRCSAFEVKSMLRDQSDIPADSSVIDELNLSDLDTDSIVGYRNHFAVLKPTHVWNRLDTDSFLQKTGAARRSEAGQLKPTLAGLLMFGTEDVITQILPDYFLDYREIYDSERWSDRVVSNLGEWSGNIFDFFFKIVNRLTSDIKIPFRLRNGIERASDTPIHVALREALANAVIHADYHGRMGIVVEKRRNQITISNPGIFRPGIAEALGGGISDPRNPTVFKLFALLDIGERAGSGLFNIQTVWKDMGWEVPVWKEHLVQGRVTLTAQVEFEEKNGSPDAEGGQKGGQKDTEGGQKDTEGGQKSGQKDDTDCITDVLTEPLDDKTYPLGDPFSEKGDPLGDPFSEKGDPLGDPFSEKGDPLGDPFSEKGDPFGDPFSEKGDPLRDPFSEKGDPFSEKGDPLITHGEEKLLAYIRENNKITKEEIALKLGISPSVVKKHIRKLRDKGILSRTGTNRTGYWVINL